MFQHKAWRTDSPHLRRSRPRVEELEPRVVPYTTTGNAWVHPETVTISFVPDGTTIAYNGQGQPIPSTLFQDMNARFGSPSVWQKQMLLGAQWWANATNINFTVVGDSGVPIGQATGTYQQGDPTIGDIRIGGFKNPGSGTLAAAYQAPQANNYSLAGDVYFNTSQAFGIQTGYDLASVTAHELGHSIGLDHSTNPSAIMATYYSGTASALLPDDAAGARAIYSNGLPRAFDIFGGYNNSFATAPWYSINPLTRTGLISPAEITTIGQNEYFAFIAPLNTASTLQVKVQSQGLSLLMPAVTVYNAFQNPVAYQNGLGQLGGTTLNVTVNNVQPAYLYYVKVSGAEYNALGTGRYGLSFSFGDSAPPAIPLFYTLTANGTPLRSSGSSPEEAADVYETTDASITGQLPGAAPAPAPVGQMETAIRTALDELSNWETHPAESITGRLNRAIGRFWEVFAAHDADATEADIMSWDEAVPALFGRPR